MSGTHRSSWRLWRWLPAASRNSRYRRCAGTLTLNIYKQHEQHAPQQLAVEAVAVGGLQEQHVQALCGRELRGQRQRGRQAISGRPSIPPALLAHPITRKAPCPCETPRAPLHKRPCMSDKGNHAE